jgi:uncharacterized protein YndB with AHSA1/START domain
MNDYIENEIELKAHVSRVWKALTDSEEFGHWFRVKFEEAFAIKQTCRGQLTYPGYEHYVIEIVVQKMEPEHIFSFTWHPYALDKKRDYSKEEPTLVEFRLEKIDTGTRLHVTESGFNSLPEDRRFEAFRMNNDGWEEQMNNIKNYIE